jgi:hypothetical protein
VTETVELLVGRAAKLRTAVRERDPGRVRAAWPSYSGKHKKQG